MQSSHPIQELSAHSYNQLKQIRQELVKFKANACGLQHEKMNSSSVTNDTAGGVDSLPVQRHPLCPADSRKWLLSCAHTTAAFSFKRLIRSLLLTGLCPGLEVLLQQLEDITTSIYLLDIDKGRLEKAIALFTGKSAMTEELDALKIQSRNLSGQHSCLANQLLQLQTTILKQVDESMLPYKKEEPALHLVENLNKG